MSTADILMLTPMTTSAIIVGMAKHPPLRDESCHNTDTHAPAIFGRRLNFCMLFAE